MLKISIGLSNKILNGFILTHGRILEKFPNLAQLDMCNVLHSISDHKALILFNTIALAADSAPIAISRLKMTRKQYYSRMSAMTDAGLITRRSGKYFLTSFGKVVYEAHMLIGRAQQNYWKLKAVDAIEFASNDALTSEQRDGFINSLIDDNELKKALLNNKELISLPQTSLPAKRP